MEFKCYWINIFKKYKSKLDLSSVDSNGSHTLAVRGEEQVAYQEGKNDKRSLLNSVSS